MSHNEELEIARQKHRENFAKGDFMCNLEQMIVNMKGEDMYDLYELCSMYVNHPKIFIQYIKYKGY